MSETDDIGQEETRLSLDTIPVEVFLHICTFLDGKEIFENLKAVCRSFNEILSDDAVWRSWLKQRWPKLPNSSICYKDDGIPGQSVCLQVDRGLKLWSREEGKINKWVQDSVHISTVDSVKLIKGGQVGVSGSRDRSLAVWDTTEKLTLLEHRVNAHGGWIWDLASCPQQDSQLYSCSWDSTVKLWALDAGQLVESSFFKCSAAALALVCRPGLVATGLFTAKVEVFDPRCPSPVYMYMAHTRPILALCIVRDFLVAASEDQTLSVYSITAGKMFRSGVQVCTEGHPMTLSFSDGKLLFVGDTRSRLHIFDMENDSLERLECFDLGHEPRGSITSMWHNPGFIFTGSKDATVRIHTTTRPPHLINRLSSPTSNGITAVDFADPVLFVGCVNSAVEMWVPS